jgi:hypothetical protein
MPIFYALIARGKNVVLAEYTARTGNFATVTRVLLGKIGPEDAKMSYVYDSYVFHYMVEDGITYLCLADEQQKRRIPFLFLQDVKERCVWLPQACLLFVAAGGGALERRLVLAARTTRSQAIPVTKARPPPLPRLRRFTSQYGDRIKTAISFAMNSEFSRVSDMRAAVDTDID